MNVKKPIPLYVAPTVRLCPVCKKQSYSLEGIHPQCASIQADSERRTLLAAKKKAIADAKGD